MADLPSLLEKTSRTFALSIPLLPEPTRRQVTLAYLLFRIADTFEDSTRWPREDRIVALNEFCTLVEHPETAAGAGMTRRWVEELPLSHDGYRELIEEVPFVLMCFGQLDPAARRIVEWHTLRTARGMAGFVARTGGDGELCLRSLADLREYCYVVAGIVGEMLTELFVLGRPPLQEIAPYLRERARAFGEGLQLVNILKDSASDAREGRVYVPQSVERDAVFEVAQRDLAAAAEYTTALQEHGAERGLIAFNALPVLLARATLERVRRKGPGAKISRPEVWTIVRRMEKALDANRPVLNMPARSPAP